MPVFLMKYMGGIGKFNLNVTCDGCTPDSNNPTTIKKSEVVTLNFSIDASSSSNWVRFSVQNATVVSMTPTSLSIRKPVGQVNISATAFELVVQKGDVLQMNLGNPETNRYRVLSVNGSIVKVAAMYKTLISCRGCSNVYENSQLDTMLDQTWYGSLSDTAKSAIVPTTVDMDQWTEVLDNAPDNYEFSMAYSTRTSYMVLNHEFTKIVRNVYAFNISEYAKYFGYTNKATADISAFDALLGDYTLNDYPWLSSLYSTTYWSWCVYKESTTGNVPIFSGVSPNSSNKSIPTFSIDLSKIEYTVEE